MNTTTRRAGVLLVLVGLLAATSAFMPCRELVPPPPRMVDPATASIAELLALPRVGPARAEALWAERMLNPAASAPRK